MTNAISNVGRIVWRTAFEISPIILTRGIAKLIPGGMLPIVTFTEALNLVGDLVNLQMPSLDQMFSHWQVLPGTQLMRNNIGSYPFANQNTAANAIIKEPLTISMIMHCPVQNAGGYLVKLATIAGVKATLDYHAQNGGTYTVATPSYIYTDCILLNVTDVSGGESNQIQTSWQFDFIQPLVTNQTKSVQNNLMSKITAGTPVVGQPTWSGLGGALSGGLF